MKLRPMLQVDDVAASRRWYRDVLGLIPGHGGEEYEMLFDQDDFVLQLHRRDAHEHRFLGPASGGAPGGGVSLWFQHADRPAFEAAVERARTSGATIVSEPEWNPVAHHHEASLVDPDGYVVVLHSAFEMPG